MTPTLASPPANAFRRRRRKRRIAFTALAILFFAAIVLLTMLPPEAKQFLHTRGRFHSAGHIVAFAALAFAAGRTTRSKPALLLILLALLAFGFCTEFAEHLIFNIELEWRDIRGDVIGCVLGLSAAVLTRRHRRLPQTSTA